MNDTPFEALQTSTYISVVNGRNKKPMNGHQRVLNASSRELLNNHIKKRMNRGENSNSSANARKAILQTIISRKIRKDLRQRVSRL